VKIVSLELVPRAYPLRRPLAAGRSVLSARRGAIVRIGDELGHRGHGEALPLPGAGTESPERCSRALEAARVALPGLSGGLDELLDRIDARWPDAPAARCALDVALHDLEALRRGIPVARLLAGVPLAEVPVNALLGSVADDDVLERARGALGRGYRALKLKAGGHEARACIERLGELRALAGPGVRLRLDANGAWSEPEARRALAPLAALDLELLEQPIAAGELAALARLACDSPIPIAADESLAREAGRVALQAGRLAPAAVLKPMVLGGLRAAAHLARGAAAVGVRCLVTTTLDGPIATAAALHLAAAVCDGSYACGLASADVLDWPFPGMLVPCAGRLAVSPRAGLGVEVELG
jgi:o-succinylbenzoate synthase